MRSTVWTVGTRGCRRGSTTGPVSLNSVHSEGRYGLEDAGEVLYHAVQVSGQPPSLSFYILHQGRVHNLKNLYSLTLVSRILFKSQKDHKDFYDLIKIT
jgi:hypothetical protein